MLSIILSPKQRSLNSKLFFYQVNFAQYFYRMCHNVIRLSGKVNKCFFTMIKFLALTINIKKYLFNPSLSEMADILSGS